MARLHNFSAGPAAIPLEVLEASAAGLSDYRGTGIGVPEMSHRSKAFIAIMDEAVAGVRDLLKVPADYEVLFLQGGATLQFAMLAMNLLKNRGDYVITGVWAEKAYSEAGAIGAVEAVASSKDARYSFIPKNFTQKDGSDYLHITSNNTVEGTQFRNYPRPPQGVPLVVDASSDILSRPLDFTGVGLVYAGAQKNLGPSGVVLVILRKDLLERNPRKLPEILRYSAHAKAGSMLNTPPTFSVYMVKLVLDWIRKEGGVAEMEARARRKAGLIYNLIDEGGLYRGTAAREDRSLMNITFTLPSEELTEKFLKESEKQGMEGLKGYRTVGGVRASIYNAVPLASVEALAQLMGDFSRKHG